PLPHPASALLPCPTLFRSQLGTPSVAGLLSGEIGREIGDEPVALMQFGPSRADAPAQPQPPCQQCCVSIGRRGQKIDRGRYRLRSEEHTSELQSRFELVSR